MTDVTRESLALLRQLILDLPHGFADDSAVIVSRDAVLRKLDAISNGEWNVALPSPAPEPPPDRLKQAARIIARLPRLDTEADDFSWVSLGDVLVAIADPDGAERAWPEGQPVMHLDGLTRRTAQPAPDSEAVRLLDEVERHLSVGPGYREDPYREGKALLARLDDGHRALDRLRSFLHARSAPEEASEGR